MKSFLFVVSFVLLFSSVWVTQTTKKPKVYIDEKHKSQNNTLGIPNLFLMVYKNWFYTSFYAEVKFKSIPLRVNQKNDFRLDLKASLPKINASKVKRVEIVIEFHKVPKPSKTLNGTFHAHIIPRDSRIPGKTQKQVEKSVHENLVEIFFEVTDLLRSHLELGKKHFKVRMNLLRNGNKTKVSFGGKSTTAFLLFNLDDNAPTAVELDDLEPTTTRDPSRKDRKSGKVPKLPKKYEHGAEYDQGNASSTTVDPDDVEPTTRDPSEKTRKYGEVPELPKKDEHGAEYDLGNASSTTVDPYDVEPTTTRDPSEKTRKYGKVPKLPKKKEHGTEYVRGKSKFHAPLSYSPRIRNYGVTCGYQRWKVSSKNLPWNIEAVYPPEIEVGRCQGGCYRIRKKPSNRQELGPYMRALYLDRSPCCVPLDLKPQLMIVNSKGFHEFRMIEGLRVGKCGCM